VCGPECRRERRRQQAKRRRAADLEQFRGDERRRQRASRTRRRAAEAASTVRAGPEPGAEGQDVTECHAPALVGKSLDLLQKVQLLWDKQVRLSRASLERELGRVGRKFREIVTEALSGAGT